MTDQQSTLTDEKDIIQEFEKADQKHFTVNHKRILMIKQQVFACEMLKKCGILLSKINKQMKDNLKSP